MSTLMQASHQWATRPNDERYTSLYAMRDHFTSSRDRSHAVVLSSRAVAVLPDDNDLKAITVRAGDYEGLPTNWAFGQLCQLTKAPSDYMQRLPAPLVADCMNYGFRFGRDASDVGILVEVEKYGTDDARILRAATGPRYGRIWNSDILDTLCKHFGDGITGHFRVPGEFGKAVEITKDNTTLFAGDRDMFVFLADEERRIEVPGGRNGQPRTLARGFFVWNSEVGSKSIGIAGFLFDYVCCNRIVWGAESINQIKINHTASAPDRWLEEILPVIDAQAKGSAQPFQEAIIAAQAQKIDDITEFLGKRNYSAAMVTNFQKVHEAEEGRPIETRWDAATAITAYARGIPNQDQRVLFEKSAGELLAA